MKRGRIYTVIFTVTLCCVCALALTFASVQWRPRIVANENFVRIRAIVDSLGLITGGEERKEVVDAYNRCIKQERKGEIEVYEGRRDGKLVGTAIEVIGRGKYGPIKGVLSVGAASMKILALRIYEQNETPGLGGKITDPKWLGQFSGKMLSMDGTPSIIISSKERGPNVVDAVTGASKTMYSIEKIINMTIASFLSGGMLLEALDLGLGVDAVTRATPGYPKHLRKPPHLREEAKRPPFMVPPGLKNIALNKAVICREDDFPLEGEMEQVTDGIKKSGDYDYVEFGPGVQWVQVDLGKVSDIHCIAIWHYYRNPIIYNDVIIQVADDAGLTENVRTLFNNDHDNSSELGEGKDTAFYARWWGELVDARGKDRRGTAARCVRVYTNGGMSEDDMTRFVEIAVYGK